MRKNIVSINKSERQQAIEDAFYLTESHEFKGQPVEIKVDGAVVNRIKHTVDLLYNQRGYPIIKQHQEKTLSKVRKKVTDKQYASDAANERLAEYRTSLMTEVSMWAVLSDSIFEASKSERGDVTLEFKLEGVEVDPDYWNRASEESNDPFLSLSSNKKAPEIYYKEDCPYENMIAWTVALIGEDTELAEKVLAAAIKAAAAASINEAVSIDRIRFLGSELDGVVSQNLAGGNKASQPSDADRGTGWDGKISVQAKRPTDVEGKGDQGESSPDSSLQPVSGGTSEGVDNYESQDELGGMGEFRPQDSGDADGSTSVSEGY